MPVPIGFALPPDEASLALLEPLILDEPDYFEIAPETLWFVDGGGALIRNGYHRAFEELGRKTGCPFVAHGVGYSVSGLDPTDDERRAIWLRQIEDSHAAFNFLWYSDHLGATRLAGRMLALPLPVPMVGEVADLTRSRLASIQRVVPTVAVENSAFYYLLGRALDEPAFLQRVVDAPGLHLVLDLHNLHTNGVNLGFDPRAWLALLPLDKVVEIHLSGGRPSEPEWLPSGNVLRLDSHDTAIPEEVWALYEEFAPRCRDLRGVTVERMEGTVTPADVPLLREELKRARFTLA